MARLGDCASIFQLAFAINAILPTLFFAFHRTHESIAFRFAKEVKKHDPTLVLGDPEMPVFLKLVKGSSPGLKISDLMKWIPLAASGVATVFGFLGLLFGATTPNTTLSNNLLWVFAIYSLILCPALGLAYELWLRFLERMIITKWANNAEKMDEMAASFRSMLETEKIMADVRAAFKKAEKASVELEMKMKIRRLKQNVQRARVKIQSARASIGRVFKV